MIKLIAESFGTFEDTLDKSREYILFSPGTEPWQIYKRTIRGKMKYNTVDKAYKEMTKLENAIESGNDSESEQDAYYEAYKKWWKLYSDYKRDADVYFKDLVDKGYVEFDSVDGFIAVYLD